MMEPARRRLALVLLAIAGRNVAVDELSGPGVATLRPRLDRASAA